MALSEEVLFPVHVVLPGLVLLQTGGSAFKMAHSWQTGGAHRLVAWLVPGSSSHGSLHVVCFSQHGWVPWTSVPRDRAM